MKLHTQEQKQHKAPRLFLKKTEGGQKIDFKNTPFSVEEEKIMDCQYGHHYFLKKQGKHKQLRLQDTKKVGCQAIIKIKSFTLHPEYSLPKQSLSSRQQKQLQEEVLEQLRQDLASGKAV